MFIRLVSISTGRNLARSLAVLLVFMVAMNLGATAFYRYTDGVGILDTAGGANLLDNRTSGYSPELAYHMIAAYGSQGIRYHLMLTTADLFFPPILAFFLLQAITYFYSQMFKSRPITRWLVALPIVYLISDYLENVGIATMLLSFPSNVPSMARLANAMFMIKNLSSSVTVLAILVGLVLRAMQRVRDLRTKSEWEGRLSK